MTLSRRSLITGLVSFAVTAPAIVRAASLMPVKQMIEPVLAVSDCGHGDVTIITFYRNRVFWVLNQEPQTVHWTVQGSRASEWIERIIEGSK